MPPDPDTTSMTVKLAPVKPTASGEEVVLKDPVTVLGRGRGCTVCVLDPTVSRQHCKLTLAGDRLIIRDLGSANGTYVNLTRVHERELKDGDVLTVGQHQFAVHIEGAAEEAAARTGQAQGAPGSPAANVHELGQPGPSAGADPTEVLFRDAPSVPRPAESHQTLPDAGEISQGAAEAALLAALGQERGAGQAEANHDAMSDEARAALLAALTDIAAHHADRLTQEAPPGEGGLASAGQAPEPPDDAQLLPASRAPVDQLLEADDDSIYEEPDDESVALDEDIAAIAAELRLVQLEMEQELREMTAAEPPRPAGLDEHEEGAEFAAGQAEREAPPAPAAAAVAPPSLEEGTLDSAAPPQPEVAEQLDTLEEVEPARIQAAVEEAAPQPPPAIDEPLARPGEPLGPEALDGSPAETEPAAAYDEEDLPEGRPSLRPIFEPDEGRQEAALPAGSTAELPEDSPALAPSHGRIRRGSDVATVDVLGELADEHPQPVTPQAEGAPDDEAACVDLLGQVADQLVAEPSEPAAAPDEAAAAAAGPSAGRLVEPAEEAVDVLSEAAAGGQLATGLEEPPAIEPAAPAEVAPEGEAPAEDTLQAEEPEAEPPEAPPTVSEGQAAVEAAVEPPEAPAEAEAEAEAEGEAVPPPAEAREEPSAEEPSAEEPSAEEPSGDDRRAACPPGVEAAELPEPSFAATDESDADVAAALELLAAEELTAEKAEAPPTAPQEEPAPAGGLDQEAAWPEADRAGMLRPFAPLGASAWPPATAEGPAEVAEELPDETLPPSAPQADIVPSGLATEAPPPAAVPIEPCTSPHPLEDVETPADRPLPEGARKGERGLVSLFLSKGADVDAPAGPHDATALHYAAGNGHIMIVEFLVARGANVNALDSAGATPLYWAKLLGHDEVVRFLLSRGADPNAIEGVEAQ